MAPSRWLAVPVFVFLGAALAASCSQVSPGSGTSTSTSGPGGGGGSGGAGSSQVAATTAGTGGMPEAGPIPCPDHSYTNIKSVGDCDLLQQNCGPGQTCREIFNGVWTTKCSEADGLKGEGETCYIDTECLATLHCAIGRCAPVCCPKNNQPCAGGVCNLRFTLDSKSTYKQLCHYAKQCDILAPDACPAGFDCHIEDAKQGLATCVQPSKTMVPDLGYCKFLNDCGNIMEGCFPQSGGTCHFYCYLDPTHPLASASPGRGGCPNGQVCGTTVNGKNYDLGVEGLGLCEVPGGSSSSSGGMSDAGTD